MKFVDELPDTPNRERGEWRGTADALRARPCQWAFIRSYASTSAAGTTVRNQHGRNGLEVVRRGRDVYARWIGEPEEKTR